MYTHPDKKNKMVISFFGPPGSGKGTLATKCTQELGFVVLSTGNLCREVVNSGSDLGKKLEIYLNAGQLIPDKLISKMTEEWLFDKLNQGKKIILDGYPRTLFQAEKLFELSKSQKSGFNFSVVVFDISHDEIIKRLSNRLMCSNKDCQRVYSSVAIKPVKDGICDSCGSKLFIRKDDNFDVIVERLKIYDSNKEDIMKFYDSVEQKIVHIDTGKLTPDEVYDCFKKYLQDF